MPIFFNPDPQRIGEDRFVQNPFSQALGQFFRGELLAVEIFFQEGIIGFGNGFDELFPGALRLFFQVGRNLPFGEFPLRLFSNL